MRATDLTTVGITLLALCVPARADFNRTTLLIDTPTADVMTAGSFAISGIATSPIFDNPEYPGWEGGASLRVSPISGLEVAVTAYTPKDYVLGVTAQLISGGGKRVSLLDVLDPWKRGQGQLNFDEARYTSLAVGVYDVGIHGYVSPVGNGKEGAWQDWQYYSTGGEYIRPYENFSAFVVTSIPITGLARISVGLGRGRFVGYDGPNDYFNSDVFFDDYHQWAIGLFGGVELYLTPQVALCAEADSRDANAGIKGFFGPVSVLFAVCKIEGLTTKSEANRFSRFAIDVSWQVDNLLRRGASEPR